MEGSVPSAAPIFDAAILLLSPCVWVGKAVVQALPSASSSANVFGVHPLSRRHRVGAVRGTGNTNPLEVDMIQKGAFQDVHVPVDISTPSVFDQDVQTKEMD